MLFTINVCNGLDVKLRMSLFLVEGTIRTSAITKNSSVKIMMPDNRKENQRKSFGQRQHNKAKDFLVSYNNEQLAALQSFLATDSPTKLEMALLATPVESVFRYVRGYLAVVLNRKKFFGKSIINLTVSSFSELIPK
jgi:hypothetical protein